LAGFNLATLRSTVEPYNHWANYAHVVCTFSDIFYRFCLKPFLANKVWFVFFYDIFLFFPFFTNPTGGLCHRFFWTPRGLFVDFLIKAYLPKSHNFKMADSGSKSKFCGLISRWQMPIECIYARLRNNWYINNLKRRERKKSKFKANPDLIKVILVSTYFNIKHWYCLLGLGVVSRYFIHSFRYKLQD